MWGWRGGGRVLKKIGGRILTNMIFTSKLFKLNPNIYLISTKKNIFPLFHAAIFYLVGHKVAVNQ